MRWGNHSLMMYLRCIRKVVVVGVNNIVCNLQGTVYISALDSSDLELVPLPQMPRFVFRITPRALSCNITAHFDSSRHTFISAQHAVF